MENVILIVHLFLALGLIGVVLLQRSEGGGLGIGGGGGAMSQRAPLTALGKVTWILAIGFIITSITLTVIAASNASGTSILDRLGTSAPADAPVPAPGLGDLNPADLLPPPSADGVDADAPLVPKAD